jgi:glucosamine-6-phosphate deaminase
MSSDIDPQALFAWCSIPTDQLEGNPNAKVPIRILPTPDDVHRLIAGMMVEEIKANNAAGRPTRWILPAGPMRQYPYFAKAVNEERISLHDLHVFHMDEFLDWEARPLPLDHPFSLKGMMLRGFYGLIDRELNVPAEQRHFPDVYDIDGLSNAIRAAGGVDTTWGGIGFHGHVAFNEPPLSPWYTVTREEYRNSQTRILALNVDTLIAQAQRQVGGLTQIVPPMAMTIGMKDILSAGRIRLLSDTGAWKQTVIRVLLFGPTTTEYPVTFVQGHPDVLVVVDEATAAPPLH